MANLFRKSIDSNHGTIHRKPVHEDAKAIGRSSRAPTWGATSTEPPPTSHSSHIPRGMNPPPISKSTDLRQGHSRHDSATVQIMSSPPKRTSSLKNVLNAYYKIFGGQPPRKPPRNEQPAEEAERLRRTVRTYERQLEEASNTLLLQDKILAKWEKQGWQARKEDVLEDRQPPSGPHWRDSATPTGDSDAVKILEAGGYGATTTGIPEGRLTALTESSKEMLGELTTTEKADGSGDATVSDEKPASINRSLETAETTAKEQSEKYTASKEAAARKQEEEYAELKRATEEALAATMESKHQLEAEVESLKAELGSARATTAVPTIRDVEEPETSNALQVRIEQLEAQLTDATTAAERHGKELLSYKYSQSKELAAVTEASRTSSIEAESLRKLLEDSNASHQKTREALEFAQSELARKIELVSTHETSLAERELALSNLVASHENVLNDGQKELATVRERIAQLAADLEKASGDRIEVKTALEEAHAESERLHAELMADSKATADALSKDLEAAQNQVTKLTADLESASANHMEARTSLKTAQNEIREQHLSLESVGAQETSLKEQLARLQEEVQTARASHESSSQDIEARIVEMAILQEHLSSAQAELASARAESEMARKDLESHEVLDVERTSRIEELQSQLDRHIASKAELQGELDNQIALKAEPQGELDNHMASKAELRSELDGHVASRAQLEKDLDTHANHIADLMRDINGHVASKTDLQQELEGLRALSDQHQLAQARLLELSSESENHAATKTGLEAAESRLTEVNQQLESQIVRNAELKLRVTALEENIASHAATEANLETAHAKIAELSEQADKGDVASTELSAAKIRVQELSKTLDDHARLQGELNAAQLHIQELSGDYDAEKAEHDVTRTKFTDLSKEVEGHQSVKSDLETAQNRLLELEIDLEAGKAVHDSVQGRLIAAETSLAAATSHHDNLLQSIATKDRMLEEVQADLEEITKALVERDAALKEANEALQDAKQLAASLDELRIKSNKSEEQLLEAQTALAAVTAQYESEKATLAERIADLEKLSEKNHRLAQELGAAQVAKTMASSSHSNLVNEHFKLQKDYAALRSSQDAIQAPEDEKHRSRFTEALLAGGATVAGGFGLANAVEHHEVKERVNDVENQDGEAITEPPTSDKAIDDALRIQGRTISAEGHEALPVRTDADTEEIPAIRAADVDVTTEEPATPVDLTVPGESIAPEALPASKHSSQRQEATEIDDEIQADIQLPPTHDAEPSEQNFELLTNNYSPEVVAAELEPEVGINPRAGGYKQSSLQTGKSMYAETAGSLGVEKEEDSRASTPVDATAKETFSGPYRGPVIHDDEAPEARNRDCAPSEPDLESVIESQADAEGTDSDETNAKALEPPAEDIRARAGDLVANTIDLQDSQLDTITGSDTNQESEPPEFITQAEPTAESDEVASMFTEEPTVSEREGSTEPFASNSDDETSTAKPQREEVDQASPVEIAEPGHESVEDNTSASHLANDTESDGDQSPVPRDPESPNEASPIDTPEAAEEDQSTKEIDGRESSEGALASAVSGGSEIRVDTGDDDHNTSEASPAEPITKDSKVSVENDSALEDEPSEFLTAIDVVENSNASKEHESHDNALEELDMEGPVAEEPILPIEHDSLDEQSSETFPPKDVLEDFDDPIEHASQCEQPPETNAGKDTPIEHESKDNTVLDESVPANDIVGKPKVDEGDTHEPLEAESVSIEKEHPAPAVADHHEPLSSKVGTLSEKDIRSIQEAPETHFEPVQEDHAAREAAEEEQATPVQSPSHANNLQSGPEQLESNTPAPYSKIQAIPHLNVEPETEEPTVESTGNEGNPTSDHESSIEHTPIGHTEVDQTSTHHHEPVIERSSFDHSKGEETFANESILGTEHILASQANGENESKPQEDYSPMPSSPEFSPVPSTPNSPSRRKSVRWDDIETPKRQSPDVDSSEELSGPKSIEHAPSSEDVEELSTATEETHNETEAEPKGVQVNSDEDEKGIAARLPDHGSPDVCSEVDPDPVTPPASHIHGKSNNMGKAEMEVVEDKSEAERDEDASKQNDTASAHEHDEQTNEEKLLAERAAQLLGNIKYNGGTL